MINPDGLGTSEGRHIYWPESSGDEHPVDVAYVPEGDPVVDGNKMPAVPTSMWLGALEHHLRTKGADTIAAYETMLIGEYRKNNLQWFDGRLPDLHITMSIPRSPNTVLGAYHFEGQHGARGEIVINRRLAENWFENKSDFPDMAEEGRFCRFLKDILLHEMIHAHCHHVVMNNEETYGCHGPIFRDVCNRIGDKLGYQRVRSKWDQPRRLSHVPACNYWPHNVVPPGTYPKFCTEGVLLKYLKPIKEKKAKVAPSESEGCGKSERMGPLTEEEMLSLVNGPDGGAKQLVKILEVAKMAEDTSEGHRRIAYQVVRCFRDVFTRPDYLPQFTIPVDGGGSEG